MIHRTFPDSKACNAGADGLVQRRLRPELLGDFLFEDRLDVIDQITQVSWRGQHLGVAHPIAHTHRQVREAIDELD